MKNRPMKIVTVVGARPQFIKAAAVNRAVRAFNGSLKSRSRDHIREILIHTGQHYDYLMDRVFFKELKLPKPDYHLGAGSGSHAVQTAKMLEGVEGVLEKEKPEITLVYGDTNSTLAGALAAAKLNIPVAHVEAGLRSYKPSMPEEINRVVADHLSYVLFCPTAQAVRNLSREGIRHGDQRVVRNVGDVMFDSILYYSQIAEKKSTILKDLDLLFPKTHNSKLVTRNYCLATLHRAENTDHPNKLKSILRGLAEIAKDLPVVLPIHPRTRKMIGVHRLLKEVKGIKLIDPVSYFDMITLERHATMILTDSGGVQKEAYWFGVPCITLRDETEWGETIRSGWNVLAGTESYRIVKAVKRQMRRGCPTAKTRLFGDGRAGEKIVRVLAQYF